MSDIIDFDAGGIVRGEPNRRMRRKAAELSIDVASGKRSQRRVARQNDFIPWKPRVSL